MADNVIQGAPVLCRPMTPDNLREATAEGYRPVEVACTKCGAKLLAAASTQELIANGARPFCFGCHAPEPATLYIPAFSGAAVLEMENAAKLKAKREAEKN